VAVDHALHAEPLDVLEGLDGRQVAGSGRDDRRRHRVLRRRLDRRG
jgi:hypothetical protein